ncbi:MAG: glycosyltransferase family 2 protein [Candidatus Brocadiaceae bacterium]|nr:glycosyltransferase family 2 protein [Candidatus Brocadiaceae bacterium]
MMVSREYSQARNPPIASVLIPTFGNARFARWAIESVQRQTMKDIEIFIICDGSPPQMVSFFKNMATEDSRIMVYSFPKAARAGEPYRDMIIKKEARGRHIFYCSHDDIWFSNHIEVLSSLLRHKSFVHSIHVAVKEDGLHEGVFIRYVVNADIALAEYRNKMQNVTVPRNFFGLTYGAHTREAYLQLNEGWATTPRGIPTDLYMWRKFLARFPLGCATCKKVTALHFPVGFRNEWPESEQKREEELLFYFNHIQAPGFIEKVNEIAIRTLSAQEQKGNCFSPCGFRYRKLRRRLQVFWAQLKTKAMKIMRTGFKNKNL